MIYLICAGMIFYLVIALTIIISAADDEDRKWLWVCLSWPWVLLKGLVGKSKDEEQTKYEEPL